MQTSTHIDLTKNQVYISPAQGKQLRTSHTGEKGCIEQRMIWSVLNDIKKPNNIIFLPSLHISFFNPGRFNSIGNIP
jgi:hypothetical protein